jgi:hypothetical protein
MRRRVRKMSSKTCCNFCLLKAITSDYDPQEVEIVDKPLGKLFPKGKEVWIEGRFVAWFGSVEDKCHCDD